MSGTIIYRIATVADADQILDIYRPYIESTAVTFEQDVPTAEAFRARVAQILKQYPYLVAEVDGRIVGYSYASPYRSRAGFRWTAELSVYVHQDYHGNHIGTHLYAALLDLLRIQGYQNICSVISWPNPGSEHLHRRFGFRLAGVQKKTGFKNGHWCDIAIFERCLGDYPVPPEEPIPFSQLPACDVERILKV